MRDIKRKINNLIDGLDTRFKGKERLNCDFQVPGPVKLFANIVIHWNNVPYGRPILRSRVQLSKVECSVDVCLGFTKNTKARDIKLGVIQIQVLTQVVKPTWEKLYRLRRRKLKTVSKDPILLPGQIIRHNGKGDRVTRVVGGNLESLSGNPIEQRFSVQTFLR